MYYCPKCDRRVSKEHLARIEEELVERFGKSSLATLRCPVCDSEFIDLEQVEPGGEAHVGEARKRSSS